MNYKVHLVELEDGFVGDLMEVSKHIGISHKTVYDSVRFERPLIAKKYKYKDLGVKYLCSIYELDDENEGKIIGDKVELARRLNYSISNIGSLIKKGKIKRIRREYRDEPMRL